MLDEHAIGVGQEERGGEAPPSASDNRQCADAAGYSFELRNERRAAWTLTEQGDSLLQIANDSAGLTKELLP